MKTPHKHAELIKAWADGAEIQLKAATGDIWVSATPDWDIDLEYRIKPEPRADVVRYGVASINNATILVRFLGPINARYDNNLKLTFDSETNKLIKAEVI